MTTGTRPKSPYPSAREGAVSAQLHADSAQCKSASYRLAFQDPEFLLRDDLRSVRLQLELLKPEIILREQHIESTVVVFGSSRLVDPETAEARLVSAQTEYDKKKDDPLLVRKLAAARHALVNSRYYSEARKLGHLISSNTGKDKLVVITGGGPGIMEAANRGAHDAGMPSIGMNIVLPHEQSPNPYITPDLNFLLPFAKCIFCCGPRVWWSFPAASERWMNCLKPSPLFRRVKCSPFPCCCLGNPTGSGLSIFKLWWKRALSAPRILNCFLMLKVLKMPGR